MEQKRFTKNDDTFICKNCGLEVKPLGYSSRNHCPRCLCSLHVDINPAPGKLKLEWNRGPQGGHQTPVTTVPASAYSH